MVKQLGGLVRFEMPHMPILGSSGVRPGCLTMLALTEGLVFLTKSGDCLSLQGGEMSGLLKWSSPQLTQLVSSCSQSIDIFIDEVEDLLSDTRARLKLVAITYEPAIPS